MSINHEALPMGDATPPIQFRASDSQPSWPEEIKAPDRATNVIFIVLDDVGFAQIGCYGGLGGRINTPNIDALAGNGLRYRNFHTTALCSPSRAALMTGRNHHSVGIGIIMEFATGYPGYHGRIPKSAAFLPTVLKENGYNTIALGKWHLAPDEHLSASGPFDRWPLGQGFERYYGFLSAECDQYYPDLWQDNTKVDPPGTPEEGYHLSVDLVDHAISMIDEQHVVTPSKPYFTYLAFGACHEPHQAPKDYIDAYRGVFDSGWDAIRVETLARQIELGVVPDGTVLPPTNPGVKPWVDLTETERAVFCRQMEVYAAFLTHTDDQIGRLVDYLRDSGQLDDTMIVLLSDNGASGEGGPTGISSEMAYANGAAQDVEDMVDMLDGWGLPGSGVHYAAGWAMAGNTPQRWYKQMVHEGGTRDPLIIHWPNRVADKGAVREQYHHIVDIVPTILDEIGIEWPTTVAGHEQIPLEGTSFAYTLHDGAAPTRKDRQYFEIVSHRAIWKDGWKAVVFHDSPAMHAALGTPYKEWGSYDDDVWELYHLDEDFSESNDLASERPELLAQLQRTWLEDARRFNVLPLDDTYVQRLAIPRPLVFEERSHYEFTRRVRLLRSGSPDVRNRSHTITADVEVSGDTEGVIVSNGGHGGGYTLCIQDGRAVYVSNHFGITHTVLRSAEIMAPGPHRVGLEFVRTEGSAGVATLTVDGRGPVTIAVPATNPVVYAVTEGLEVGSDSGIAVWPGYASPFDFTGRIVSVVLDLGGDQALDHQAEAALAMLRQ